MPKTVKTKPVSKPERTRKTAQTPIRAAGSRARIDVPEEVKLELWARAAGRCEYRGCAKPLYLEPLTKARLNIAHIAHIVAAQPGGPRGDAVRSKLLETEIGNLMLACRDHHAVCDYRGSGEGVERHTEAELRSMKSYFEGFVEHAISMVPKHGTHVLTVLGRVSGNTTRVTDSEIRQALWQEQLYPINTKPNAIATMASDGTDDVDETGWQEVRRKTERRIDHLFEDDPPEHVSVFALARIPLLVTVGYRLGDKVPVQTFQQTNGRWPWPDPSAVGNFDLTVPTHPKNHSDIVLKLEVSGSIPDHSIPPALVRGTAHYTIRFEQPRLFAVRSPAQVTAFSEKVRQFYEGLNADAEGNNRTVHVFCAIPAALAVEFGRALRHHFSRTKVYELREGQWQFALEFNVPSGA